MKAGTLRNIITIQQTTQTRNDAGEIVDTWATYSSPWAEILPLQGREFWAAQQVQNEEMLRIRIRYDDGVTTRMRVVYGDRAWDIKSAVNVGTLNKQTEIIAVLSPNEYKATDFNKITDVHAIEIGATTARVFFTTNNAGNTKVVYGTVNDPNMLDSHKTDETDCTFHSMVLSGLTASTPYYFRVLSQDAAGLWATTDDVFTFTTLAGIPGGTLMVSDVEFTVTKSAITAAFNTDEDCKCNIFGKLSTDDDFVLWVNVVAEHASPHSHQKVGLVESTVYHLQITCATDEGLITYQPSETGYYVIRTGPDDITAGEVIGIQA